MLVFRRQSRSTLQVIDDVKDLKFRACQLMYTFMRKQVFEGLVTYSKVKHDKSWICYSLYGSIFTSMLLVKVVWGKIRGHT